MAQLMEYKCPNCGGGLEFNSSVQKMKCPFCDAEFEMDALAIYDQDLKEDGDSQMEWESSAANTWQEGETDNMRVYVCESCSGEVIADETLGATACPYCGNPVVMKGQFQGDLKPDYVIPFKLDKEAAKRNFREHLVGKKLLPKSFKTEANIEEIKGVYVPFWLFDANAKARARFKGTKVRSWSDSRYNYTQTKYYSVVRGGSLDFTHVPVDGSTKMDDALMESLEPFDFKDAVDFQTAYLSGYLADKYDVDEETTVKRANTRIEKSALEAIEKTVTGYATVTCEDSAIRLSNTASKYALYPVWVMTTKWRDNIYMFAMNGQTGKFVGNLPCDKGLYKKYLFLSGGIAFAVSLAITYLVYML
ncbi:MAG: hypothetical protein K6D96_02775 [Acetatifactor sp.]|nr:hypothetical protein [Acetatifactor sp.]